MKWETLFLLQTHLTVTVADRRSTAQSLVSQTLLNNIGIKKR